MPERYVVIMAGGRGERFWPQSCEATPKHLLPIVGDKSMLAQTVDRVAGIVPRENICVLTTRSQFDGCRAACPDLPAENIVAEWVGRDTAAATAVAMLMVKRKNPNAAFAMLPADHVIHDTAEYQKLLNVAFESAEMADVLVTLGIKPTAPETGFGYIQQSGLWQTVGGRQVMKVKRFVEKPNLETAKAYLASGEYYWNAGMFVWRVPVVEAAFKAHAPEFYTGVQKFEEFVKLPKDWDEALKTIHPTWQRISVDYALMEKSPNVVVVPATFDWDDVGAWPAIAKHFTPDAAGNVLRGTAMVEAGSNNIVVSTDGHLTAVIGASDLVVVHTPQATLVVPKEKAQEIKALLKRLADDPAKKKFL
jgi:mannose-1-phosphate guanylyltransferase